MPSTGDVLDRLAIIQAAGFVYDQILNDSMRETAAVYAISHPWQMLRGFQVLEAPFKGASSVVRKCL